MSGGYNNGPSVFTTTDGNDNDFKFDVINFIAFQPNGDFWVGDSSTDRACFLI